MGFRRPRTHSAEDVIRKSLAEIHSPYNDGFVQMSCKHDLYLLKCWLESEYSKLPKFAGEEKWEQDLIFEILKK